MSKKWPQKHAAGNSTDLWYKGCFIIIGVKL